VGFSFKTFYFLFQELAYLYKKASPNMHSVPESYGLPSKLEFLRIMTYLVRSTFFVNSRRFFKKRI